MSKTDKTVKYWKNLREVGYNYYLIYALDCLLWIELQSPSPARLTNEVCNRDAFPENSASPCKLFNLLAFDIDSDSWVNLQTSW